MDVPILPASCVAGSRLFWKSSLELVDSSSAKYDNPVDTDADASSVRLLISIPALNEEATIGEVLRAIPRELPGIRDTEIVVIDDGSTDGTAELALRQGAQVIQHRQQRGVGAAFGTALAYAIENEIDILVTIDADGQFNPSDIPQLVAPIIDGRADFATASRFKDPNLTPEMPFLNLWGNRRMSNLVSRLTGSRFHDVSCGMRSYNRRAMLNLNLLGEFTYTQEVFLNLAFKRFRIMEVPIRVRGTRRYGESRVASSLFTYAWRTSRIIFRAYRDYKPMRLFGLLTLILVIPGVLLDGWLMIHYLRSGSFTPHKWAGFVSIGLFMFGMLTLHIGMIGDMLNRHRIYLEELLFHSRLAGGGQKESTGKTNLRNVKRPK